MMSKETGGQAFPSPDCGHGSPYTGMTLRDYFAAKAMQSMLPAYGSIPYPMDNLSTQAYAQADSMLKAREQ